MSDAQPSPNPPDRSWPMWLFTGLGVAANVAGVYTVIREGPPTVVAVLSSLSVVLGFALVYRKLSAPIRVGIILAVILLLAGAGVIGALVDRGFAPSNIPTSFSQAAEPPPFSIASPSNTRTELFAGKVILAGTIENLGPDQLWLLDEVTDEYERTIYHRDGLATLDNGGTTWRFVNDLTDAAPGTVPVVVVRADAECDHLIATAKPDPATKLVRIPALHPSCKIVGRIEIVINEAIDS